MRSSLCGRPGQPLSWDERRDEAPRIPNGFYRSEQREQRQILPANPKRKKPPLLHPPSRSDRDYGGRANPLPAQPRAFAAPKWRLRPRRRGEGVKKASRRASILDHSSTESTEKTPSKKSLPFSALLCVLCVSALKRGHRHSKAVSSILRPADRDYGGQAATLCRRTPNFAPLRG